MTSATLKEQLTEAMKNAMRNKEKKRLGTIRMALSAVKQIEVDERTDVDDTRLLAILDKMIKQRRDSKKQYEDAERPELAQTEQDEIDVLQDFLPAALSESDIEQIVIAAIESSGASSMKDMGSVMAIVKPQIQGRGDMGSVSGIVKAKLG
ncbi:MAG: GatB/YqeY domain-containing protein [Pseudomonadales bacterium]|nr:GatB/YqeY domain-containing protein [Pseudomonadales bacterium]